MLTTFGMTVDWEAAVLRVMLLSTQSTYQANPTHRFLSELFSGGAIEIGVAGYARQTLSDKSVDVDDSFNQIDYRSGDVEFGNLGAGQNVSAIVLYEQIGGDDSTPEDDRLILFDNGHTSVILAADAPAGTTTLWVEPLAEDLAAGTTLNFGGTTGTLLLPAALGDRSLSLATGLSSSVAAGSIATDVPTTRVLSQASPPALAYLQNGTFTIPAAANGWITLSARGGTT